MPIIELPNGQTAEFPDEMSREDIKSVLRKKFPAPQSAQQPQIQDQQQSNPEMDKFKQATGIGNGRTPFSTLQDIGAGVGRGAQNIASLLGEAGQSLAGLATGGYAPQVNIREEMGLGKERPVDLGNVLASKNPNPFAVGLGQYAPAIIAGGASLPGQALSGGLYGATQAPEGERLKEGLEQGLGTYGLGKLAQLAPKGYEAAKNALSFLRPGKNAESFIQNLGGKVPGTEQRIPSDVNARRIAETLQTSVENQKASALPHKEKVLSEIGKTNISELPKFQIEKVSKLFEPESGEVNNSQITSLKNAINAYRKDDNFEKFVNKSEKIFKTELPEEKFDELENMISSKKTKYESNTDVFNDYDKRLKNVHSEFMKDKSLSNADRLIKELNERIFSYKDLQSVRNLPPSDYEKLKDFESVKKDLIHDMNSHMESQSPELKKEYQTYREKWAKNVEPYNSDTTLRKISQGQTQGITPSELKNVFSHPTKEVKKILGDLPDETKNHIIFNELTNLKTRDAKGLVNALHSLEQHEGYSELITPEMKEIKDKLSKQLKLQKIAKVTGMGTLALGSLGGLGYGLNKLKNAFTP